MSKFYKSISDRFSQFPKGEVYVHTWTERRPNGDSGLRDTNGAEDRIQSVLLHDGRYFEVFDPTDNQTPESDELRKQIIGQLDYFYNNNPTYDETAAAIMKHVEAYADRLAAKRETGARIDELKHIMQDDNYRGGVATDIAGKLQGLRVRIATLTKESDND